MTQRSSLFDLTGKAALVTGGIGLGYATGMAKQGVAIVIWGAQRGKEQGGRGEVREVGAPSVLSQIADVSDEQQVWQAFAEAVAATGGQIDCVASNAGHGPSYPVMSEIPMDQWRRILASTGPKSPTIPP